MKYPVCVAALFCSLPLSALAADVDYHVSGAWNSFYGYAFPDKDYRHRDKRQFFVNTFELNLGAEKEFNSEWNAGLYADLFAGINKRQYNYGNGLWGHEIYGIVDNPYGRLMAGETYNVAAQFHVGAPTAGKFGVNDSDIVNFIANPNWTKTKHRTAYRTLNSTAVNTDGIAAKLSYITPEFHNLTAGLSYIPDTYSRSGLVNRDARYAADDGYVVAAYYTADFVFAEMESSLGYGIFNRNDHDFSAGLRFYRAGWSIGGSWRKTCVDGDEYRITKASANPRLPDLFDNYREGHAWDIGIGYEIGPYKVALSYFESRAEQTDNQDKIWLLSNEYRLNKHVSIYLAGAKADFKGLDHNQSNRGWSAVSGFSLRF